MRMGVFEILATVCFALAIGHTFCVHGIQHIGRTRFQPHSWGARIFHLLGEVETAFGLWAALFLLVALFVDSEFVFLYIGRSNFTEPIFVLAIMAVCSARPIIDTAQFAIEAIARLLPFQRPVSFFIAAMALGPLAGSFITEPAAMALVATLLLNRFVSQGISERLKYACLALLLVNVSIGGTLTPFAAPPVLMVASKWNWDLVFMLTHFGWKGLASAALTTAATITLFRGEFAAIKWSHERAPRPTSLPKRLTYLAVLLGLVINAHNWIAVAVIFAVFGAVSWGFGEWRHVRMKPAILVALFLVSLVILGQPQRWWIESLLTRLTGGALYFSAIALTAVVDNAAITYLGSQVPDLSAAQKYLLVAGSVVGGGLTVIANAPNPVGLGILNSSFGAEGISPWRLLRAAWWPTAIAALIFLL